MVSVAEAEPISFQSPLSFPRPRRPFLQLVEEAAWVPGSDLSLGEAKSTIPYRYQEEKNVVPDQCLGKVCAGEEVS